MEKYKGWKPVWVVQDLIPEGALVIWVGRRASFKSWIVTSLSCSIAKGEDWLGQFPVKKSNVLIIDAENSPVLLADRLAKSGCKGGVYYYAGENFSFEKDTDKVIADCQKLSITVVALDTLRRGHGFDENNAEEISRLFKDYLFKFKLAGITLILLYHTKKQQQGVSLMDENDMIRGSGEFANLVDVVVFTDRNKTNPIVKIKQTKNRFAKEMEGFNVHVDITDEKATFKAVAEDDIMTFPSMLASAIRRQLENKKKGDVIPIEYFKEIAEQEGIKDNTGKGTLCRALNILMETGEITRKRKGIYVLLANGQRILQNGADSN